MSKAKSAEQVRNELISQIKLLSSYWANLEGKTDRERCDGVAFSILNIFDGTSSLPAFDLLVSPHEDDKQFNIDEGEDYYEPKMMINDCILHELFCK